MFKLTHVLATCAVVVSTTAAQAGGLSDQIVEAPVMEDVAPAAEASINPTYIVIGVLAALLIAAAVAEDDEEEVTTPPPSPGGGRSDIRLKTDIVRIGTAENGLPMYSFRYIGHSAIFTGVMAQDVLAHTPEAVFAMPDGFYAVDYDMLGLQMERLN